MSQWTPKAFSVEEKAADQVFRQRIQELKLIVENGQRLSEDDSWFLIDQVTNSRRQALQLGSGFVAVAYLAAMECATRVQASYILDLPPHLTRFAEFFAHRSMAELHRRTKDLLDLDEGGVGPNSSPSGLADHLLGKTLDFCTHVYDEEHASWKSKHRIGAFSAIRLRELDLLARRDNAMIRKYGTKQVEKIFEQQLALIAQSLGLHVVPTRSGQRTVDLICISADPAVRLSFLLEAKTTQRPYNLPRDDSRALIEYVNDVRRALTTLPPLQFVLIVGPTASSTLEGKLQRLEIEVGLPVRFCTAADIAQLRELITGPLPLNELAQRVQLGPWILPTSFIEDVRTRYEQVRETHEHFVRSMLSPRSFSRS